jgi:hypothetical protein
MKQRSMNRRGFLGSAAGLAMPPLAAGQVHPLESGKTIAEKPRQTRVVREVDVVIAGGGPTAMGAALAAASEGMKVLVLERHGMLGSVWTAGLLNPLMDSDKGWLVAELIGRLRKAGAWDDRQSRPGGFHMPVFDVETMKYVLECMMVERGIEFWYHALVTDAVMEGNRVLGAIVESKSGREAVLGKVVIDCSGDGDLSARAGVPFTLGREKDGLAQPCTLMFEIDNIKSFGKVKADDLKVHDMYLALQQAIEDHHLPIKLPYGPQRFGTPYLIKLPRPGAAAIQATHMYKIDCTDTRAVTWATVEGRRQAQEIFMQAMKFIPGLEDIRLTVTASTVGVRESRHLHGRYLLDLEDLLQSRHFEDAITSVNFPIDVHEIDPQSTEPKLVLPAGVNASKPAVCDIPFRSLLPEHLTGMLFAGRCLSGSHIAHAAYRVTGTCMATGQAAGLAAAMAVKRGIPPHKVDGSELRANLVKRGAVFFHT